MQEKHKKNATGLHLYPTHCVIEKLFCVWLAFFYFSCVFLAFLLTFGYQHVGIQIASKNQKKIPEK